MTSATSCTETSCSATSNARPWEKLQLTESFRLTHEMCEFVNNCMLTHFKHRYMRMRSRRETGVKPRYLLCSCWED